MTLVYYQTIVEIRDRQTRQLSEQQIGSIMHEITQMFGEVVPNPAVFQSYLDRYCQRKGIKPLIITDMLI